MSCSRTWEVEAARDGRLGEQEQKAHARHLVDCADCRREQRALDELQAGLRAVADTEVSDAHLRRGRQELLERALAERNQRAPQSRGSRLPLVAAFAAAALALVVWLGVHRAASSTIVVRASDGTSYRRYEDGGRPVIKLEHGRLEIEVEHTEGEPRLRVLTPDGVLDDVGTIFIVEVAAARTELVEVSSGLVRVAIVGRPVAMVKPGQLYRPYTSSSVALPEPDALSVPPRERQRDTDAEVSAQQARSPWPSTPAAKANADASRHALHRSSHTTTSAKSAIKADDSSAVDDASPAGRAFAEAVKTLDRGEAVDAARRFRAFAQTYPTDRRAEDAGYLRVVAWLRAGKSAEARSAAEEFLRRYPQGFRRQELERLLRH